MSTIRIKKGDQIKNITQTSWDLMGDKKNGWELVKENEQSVSNEAATKTTAPETGDSGKSNTPADNRSVKNEALKKTEQSVSNEADKTAAPTPAVDETEKSKNETESTEASEEFVAVAKTLKINTIKDFLDMNDIKYKQNLGDKKLIDLLATFLKNDVERLKAEFGA